jgi:hypothetical protein
MFLITLTKRNTTFHVKHPHPTLNLCNNACAPLTLTKVNVIATLTFGNVT